MALSGACALRWRRYRLGWRPVALSLACGSGATGHANAGADSPSDGGTGRAHGYAVTDVYRDSHEHSEPHGITHADADA